MKIHCFATLEVDSDATVRLALLFRLAPHGDAEFRAEYYAT